MGTLYLVATPIGNLEDMTGRAQRILRQVNLIAAEDTQHTRKLLTAFDIRTPLTSYHEHNKLNKLGYLLKQLQTGDVALVSEAGMPGISDPGYELVVAAEQGIPVVPIPGASSIVAALAVSGLPTDKFLYLGFLPRQRGQRQRLLRSVAQQPYTLMALETPHRLRPALEDMMEILGDRRLAACRELTKLHEEIFRGTVSQALAHFQEPRGEFTLVIEGYRGRPEVDPQVEKEIRWLKGQGVGARAAVAYLADKTGLSKKQLYRTWVEMGER
ncbi:MAG TPA: 16S rRNA (cytidine(1402)-2'-O)-methyltransferase [Dehalococcoidia bacterium]|nr:16S rRNA (cytidine(1402)-2'-O)-methyltransferase [Dehalococcoidia bacterium]